MKDPLQAIYEEVRDPRDVYARDMNTYDADAQLDRPFPEDEEEDRMVYRVPRKEFIRAVEVDVKVQTMNEISSEFSAISNSPEILEQVYAEGITSFLENNAVFMLWDMEKGAEKLDLNDAVEFFSEFTMGLNELDPELSGLLEEGVSFKIHIDNDQGEDVEIESEQIQY